MDKIIDKAIDLTKKEIKKHPNKILSESDFERMLAKHLENILLENNSEFSVHTQISYYEESGNSNPIYRVDILLMKEEEMEKCKKNHKGFIYGDQSYVFELKYLHEEDAVNIVRLDMEKSKLLVGNSGELYVVVLLEKQNEDRTDTIKRMWEETRAELSSEKQDKLKYRVLYK